MRRPDKNVMMMTMTMGMTTTTDRLILGTEHLVNS